MSFYDHPSSQHAEAAPPAAAPVPAPVPLYDQTEPVKLDVPAEVLADRRARGEGFLSVADDDLVEHFKGRHDLIPAQQRAAWEEASATRRDLGLSPAEGRELLQIAADLAANPPSPAEQQAQKQEAWLELLREYGPMSAVAAQQAAQELAQSDPRLREAFNGPLGDHPKVVSFLARAGQKRAARKAARNK